MKIGQTIKKLRKQKNITQEKLADYLGITYQAVSKWENGTALPDITLVMPLANFFGVSADVLFSVDEETNDAKVKEYLDEYGRMMNTGNRQGSVDVMRKALAEYPRNFEIMLNLATALWITSHRPDGSIDNDLLMESISLNERLLEDCTNDFLRHCAIQKLCFSYRDLGQKEKAIELALKLPDFGRSSSALLATLLEGEDKLIRYQLNLEFLVDEICYTISGIAKIQDSGMSVDEKIICYETSIKIYKAIFYDGNLLFYHKRLVFDYFSLAKFYMEKDVDTAI